MATKALLDVRFGIGMEGSNEEFLDISEERRSNFSGTASNPTLCRCRMNMACPLCRYIWYMPRSFSIHFFSRLSLLPHSLPYAQLRIPEEFQSVGAGLH